MQLSLILQMQNATQILMVRPAAFGYNKETAQSNGFQNNKGGDAALIQQQATEEFDNMVDILQRNGIAIHIEHDKAEPVKPDAIFPNNWIGFHPGGRVVLYPMLAQNRRWERRAAIIQDLEKEHGYKINELVDFTHLEKDGMFLEGTGSVVFDHENQMAYCSISPRSDARAFALLCKALGYEGLEFESFDGKGKPIYHTNVMLSIGSKWVVVCLDAITNHQQVGKLLQSLIWTGKEIIKVTIAQMEAFCCNVLELKDADGRLVVVMSKTAYNAFTPDQLDVFEASGKIIAVDIPTIEQYGGGGVRCMIAEIF